MINYDSRLEALFNHYLQAQPAVASHLQQAMAYAVLNGGKRIRPLLVYATGQAVGAPLENCDVAAAAIELIHAYSLIHDDLPAMDNADLRRGKPACHKAFDEATAILAGDALQPLAFEIIATHPASLDAQQRIAMTQVLSQASGLHGMAGGQSLDILGVHSLQELIRMYQLKTGMLLAASVSLGILASSFVEETQQAYLKTFAELIGFAFQLQDDLLDFENETGKPVGLDAQNQKKTYPALAGIEKTRETIQQLFNQAFTVIKPLDDKADFLRQLTSSLLQRKK